MSAPTNTPKTSDNSGRSGVRREEPLVELQLRCYRRTGHGRVTRAVVQTTSSQEGRPSCTVSAQEEAPRQHDAKPQWPRRPRQVRGPDTQGRGAHPPGSSPPNNRAPERAKQKQTGLQERATRRDSWSPTTLLPRTPAKRKRGDSQTDAASTNDGVGGTYSRFFGDNQ